MKVVKIILGFVAAFVLLAGGFMAATILSQTRPTNDQSTFKIRDFETWLNARYRVEPQARFENQVYKTRLPKVCEIRNFFLSPATI
jgi:hypothetical protein